MIKMEPNRKTAARKSPLTSRQVIEVEEEAPQVITPMKSTRKSIFRRHPIITALVTIMLAPFVLAMVLGSVEGLAQGVSQAPTTPTATITKATPTDSATDPEVTAFNDGWVDAKRDDCEQGAKIACQWLDNAHISH